MAIADSIAQRKSVYGVGINDADYVVQPTVNGKRTTCPFYRCWKSMFVRCYSSKLQTQNPTYLGCKVCDEWHYFMAFKSWMEKQDWEGNELDKDFIGDGKLYSPENCVFVSQALNLLFTDHGAARGEYLIGACWNKKEKKFTACVQVNSKRRHLGYFCNQADAHRAWYIAKLEVANGFLAAEANPRVRYAIECGIAKLQCKYGESVTLDNETSERGD